MSKNPRERKRENYIVFGTAFSCCTKIDEFISFKIMRRKWLKSHHHLSNNVETTNHFDSNLQSEQYKYFMKQLLDTIVVVN